MDVRYKLYYFDTRGKGEVIRLIFHAAGEEFEDIRVHESLWDQLKPGMPLKSLPVLEFGGRQLAQSMSIARYLAIVFDLGGKTNLQKAFIDSAAELIDEILSDALKIEFEESKKYKNHALKKFTTITLPYKLMKLEQFKLKHGKGYGYIHGNDLTYADLAAYSTFDQMVSASIISWQELEKYSYPTELRRRILEGEPRIAQYLHNRSQLKSSLL